MLLMFRMVVSLSDKKKIVFLDIDNTIADTWPSLSNKAPSYPSDNTRLAGLKPLWGSLHFIDGEFPSEFMRVYLTHRPYRSILVTLKWLRKYARLRPGDFVFFVQHPVEKLQFFQSVANSGQFSDIVIMDDLSHSHERGQVLFYEDILTAIAKRGFRYIGYDQICTLNREW